MAKICDFEVYQEKHFTWLKNEGRKKYKIVISIETLLTSFIIKMNEKKNQEIGKLVNLCHQQFIIFNT